MSLNLIYHFHSSQNQDGDFRPARYKVVYFFSPTEFLEEAFLHEMAKSIPDADHGNLTFMSLDDIKAFALRVCEELHIEQARLVSVLDYNIALDGSKDRESLQKTLSNFGDVVGTEAPKRTKGFLSKLFS
jgi:hypothetical protein